MGANKASVKIIGEGTDLFAQGYFVYDSKKSGGVTASHLRFGPQPIRSSYLLDQADFVACHQFGLLLSQPVLAAAKPGATFLLNSPYPPDEVWEPCRSASSASSSTSRSTCGSSTRSRSPPRPAWATGSTRSCSRASSSSPGCCRPDEAIARIKANVEKTYGKRGEAVVQRNYAAIDRSLERMVRVPLGPVSGRELPPLVPLTAPDFVQRVTARMMAGEGDLLPVSALPVDGTFPPARRSTRSAPSPRRSRSGTRRSASTAASARWSARTRRSG